MTDVAAKDTTAKLGARKSGTFKVGGDIKINRLGFGAMRITGPGIWGPPADREEALRTLRRLPELGIDFVDTANSYGPDVSEELIHEALHPYRRHADRHQGRVQASRTRQMGDRRAPGLSAPAGDQELQASSASSRSGSGSLHRIDPKVPREEQFAAIRSLLDDGIIRHAGLSEVSVADIEAASKVFPVATVQNRYNLVDRGSEDVLDYCEAHGIGFIPWFPLAAGNLAKPGSLLDAIAKRHMAPRRARSRSPGC